MVNLLAIGLACMISARNPDSAAGPATACDGFRDADGAPWLGRLSADKRSLRHLLKRHSFFGDAQATALKTLEAEHGLETAEYRRPHYTWGQGLRVEGEPRATWRGTP